MVKQDSEEIKNILLISRELNGERNIPKLLSLILSKARQVTKANAGSIYTVDKKLKKIIFKLTQNDTVSQKLNEFEIPINVKSIVGNAVLNQCTINIEDLYDPKSYESKFSFLINHDRSWDERMGYQSRSMLTLPMFDISHNVIGVIQLINSLHDSTNQLLKPEDFDLYVKAFDAKDVEYAEIVAMQAGIALENAKMQGEIENLFHSFVNASVTMIELRDPTTSGHSTRVAKFTLDLAKAVNRTDEGIYKNLTFNENELKEIEYASLLHDFGKLSVREHVLVKSKKLYPEQFLVIMERFKNIKASYEIECLRECIDYITNPARFPSEYNLESIEFKKQSRIKQLEDYYQFILKANEPTVLEQGDFRLLREIADCSFTDCDHLKRPFLLDNELKSLSVSRGSLTTEEFAEIQSHVVHTYEFLRQIPWGDKLSNLPQIAAKHHEKLDGSGYPTGARAVDIPIQSRIMTIADIYDALTASDRPYKKAVPKDKALSILEMEVKGGKLDSELFKIFINAKIYEQDFVK